MSDKRKFELAGIEVIKGFKRGSKYMKVEAKEIYAKSPSSEASKIFTKFCKVNKKKMDTCKVSLSVIDLDKNKTHTYSLERLYDPKKVIINGKEVLYKYKVLKKSI